MNNEIQDFQDKTVELEDNFNVDMPQKENIKENSKDVKKNDKNVSEDKNKGKKESKDDKIFTKLLDEVGELPPYKLIKRDNKKIIIFLKSLTDNQYYAVKRIVDADKTGNISFTQLNYN